MPDRMRAAPMLQISTTAPGRIRIHAGPTQPIEMPVQVLEVLAYFQGQPLDEAMATLVENGFAVEKAFLDQLWKSGFLVAAID